MMVILLFTEIALASDTLKTKIAIIAKSGKSERSLKHHDRLKESELIKIYMQSKNPDYYYIINSNKSNISLIKNGQFTSDSLFVYPLKESKYIVFDGKNSVENILIVISQNKVAELDSLFKSGQSNNIENFQFVEQQLSKKSKVLVSDKIEPIYNLGGNVRAINPTGFRTYTGTGIIFNKYEFYIKTN